MPGITDPARNTGQPELERDAQRVRKNDPDIESPALAKQTRRAARATSCLTKARHPPPAPAARRAAIFSGASNGDVRVRPPALDRAHRRNADHAITQPVARRGSEFGTASIRWARFPVANKARVCICSGASWDAVFSSDCAPRTNPRAPAESRPRSWRSPFAVSVSTVSSGRSAGERNVIRHFPGPAVKSERGDECGAGPFAKQTRQRRSRGQPPEERSPEAVVAGVLVAENPDHAAAAQEPDRFGKSFAPIEKFDPKTGALSPDESIEITIAEFLINRAEAGVAKMMGGKICAINSQLPRWLSTSTTGRPAPQLPVHFVCPFELDTRARPARPASR